MITPGFRTPEQYLRDCYEWLQMELDLRTSCGEDPQQCREALLGAIDAGRAMAERAVADYLAGECSIDRAVAEILMSHPPRSRPLSN